MGQKVNDLGITHRRLLVGQMILANRTTRQIAEELAVSVGTVSSDRQAVLADLRDAAVVDANMHRSIDLARIDVAINAVWGDVEDGNTKAIETLIKLIDRRAKMIGYDAPKKSEVDVNDPAALAAVLKTLSPKDRALLADGFREIQSALQERNQDPRSRAVEAEDVEVE